MKVLYAVLLVLIIFYLSQRFYAEKFTNMFGPLDDQGRQMNININYTQNTIYEIVKALKAMSSGQKMRLKDTKFEKFTKTTIPREYKDDVAMLLADILERLDKHHKINLRLIDFENLEVYEDATGNRNYIVDAFFQYDHCLFKEMTIRGKVDIIKYIDKDDKMMSDMRNNDKYSCGAATTPMFKKFPHVGYPVKNQYIALPSQVSVTAKEVYSDIGIDYPVPIKPRLIYLNNFQIMNSTLALGVDKIGGVATVPVFEGDRLNEKQGITDRSNDFSYLDYLVRPNLSLDKTKDLNKWPTLYDQPKNLKPYPCIPHPKCWDENGIYPKVNSNCNTNCKGLTSATTKDDNGNRVAKDNFFPLYHPAIVGQDYRDNGYQWLFDASRIEQKQSVIR